MAKLENLRLFEGFLLVFQPSQSLPCGRHFWEAGLIFPRDSGKSAYQAQVFIPNRVGQDSNSQFIQ